MRKNKKPWPAWVYGAIDRAMPDRVIAQGDDRIGRVRVDVSDWKIQVAAEVGKQLKKRGWWKP